MPLFDVECAKCAVIHYDEYAKPGDDGVPCPTCGGATQILFAAPAPTVGPSDTNPLHIAQIGMTFTSKREMEAYEKATGNYIVSGSDSAWQKTRERAREVSERDARLEGFRDFDQKRAFVRARRGR